MSGRSVPKRTDEYQTVWRIRHTPTGQYMKSGNSLYARNSRSVWAGQVQAKRAYNELPDDIRPDCVLVEYALTEIRTIDPIDGESHGH